MAQRRMFSKKITETDIFLDMPTSTQCLYFHLNMAADDDGFVGNTKTVQRMIGASADDLRLLTAKEFIIPFESGVVVIKDWKIHNYIRSDRYSETVYTDEKNRVSLKDNGQYEVGMTFGIPLGDVGKDRLGKDRLEIEKPVKIKYADRVSMTEEEYQKLTAEYGERLTKDKITDLDLWKGSKGKTTKSDYLTIRAWIRRESKEKQPTEQPSKGMWNNVKKY